MTLNRAEAIELAKGVAATDGGSDTEVLICPTTIYLDCVSQAISGSRVALGEKAVPAGL